VRPDLQVYVHVVASIALFASIGVVNVVSFAAQRRSEQHQLARVAFVSLAAVAVPSWILMLVFGAWSKSNEGWPDAVRWLQIGSGVAGAGIAVIVIATGLAFWWTRKPTGGWQPVALSAVSSVYLVALAVAWWVMTAKTPV